MTNLEGLWILFIALSLLIINLTASALLLAVRRWTQRDDTSVVKLACRNGSAIAVVAIGLSVFSWLFALVYISPAGIVDRLARPNPVLVVLLLGYTLSGVIGGYLLWDRRTELDATVSR